MSHGTLYHYTCWHGRRGIGNSGLLIPPRRLADPASYHDWQPWQFPMLDLIWLTDLPEPARYPLGLTSKTVACDRTRHRYRVAADLAEIRRWVDVRREYPLEMREGLENAPGAMPMHWWVSRAAVPVTYDPLRVVA